MEDVSEHEGSQTFIQILVILLKVHLHIDEKWHKNMKQKHYSELAFTHGKQWHKNILLKQNLPMPSYYIFLRNEGLK